MTKIFHNLHEEETALARLVERAAAGEEITIVKAGRPLAKLVPLPKKWKPRNPGGWEGQMRIAEDFDAALPEDIQAAFEGRS